MKKPELVLMSYPYLSHLQATLEMAKRLINRHHQLSITILHISNIPKFSNQNKPLEQDANSISPRIRFIELPTVDPGLSDSIRLQETLIETSKPRVKKIVSKLFPSESSNPDVPQLAGFVLDMFCVHMIDVANEFGVPTYVFFTCSAAFLGSLFHFQTWYDRLGVNLADLSDSDADLEIPTLVNKIPVKVLPTVFKTTNWFTHMMDCVKKIRETKGIIVNTFADLESFAIDSLSHIDCPPIYTVGPALNTSSDKTNNEKYKDIIKWLDDQPQESVVFLCFGSMGYFREKQVKEIASALEQGGKRFLWSLRKPPTKIESPSDYDDLNEVLPEGFLERTSAVGKVIGWAPQNDILAHKAVGGFVSHCGWNSTLESIWFGVPIVTWPIDAEQQFNAFQLVTDLGLATEEIRMDYRIDEGKIVSAKEIEKGIRSLSEDESVKKRMEEMSEKSRRTVMVGGSSYGALDRFVADVISNMP